MFLSSAKYYDAIYAAIGKNYAGEAEIAHRLIQKHKRSSGRRLLDVACGTGNHAGLLARKYQVEGLDLDPAMISIARRKHPHVRFHLGDMVDFRLSHKFDVIVCLFSSIGYVGTKARLGKAVKTMDHYLVPGGVLLIEPWFSPGQWPFRRSRPRLICVDKPDLKIVRLSRADRKGRLSILELQYLVGTPGKIIHATEFHRLGLFTRTDYLSALRAAGLDVIHHKRGLDGRGLYIGVKRGLP